ncbi:hypothetical protein MexAM1_META1p1402 [Methylorubrum extorquens AM1]|uniref:Uncharacterized protein n=1 Tax=Methylorubrum extorquens (strain ATCC 14718 / DSM 1338 / JCM 2805 / NCIMB 9133 / AM1) TaxID=272630 RepID=C5AZD0_METEA|nr:hypothetical protein MexAM1_META1p1402 [Methylorubrum extorquens AM1]
MLWVLALLGCVRRVERSAAR